MRSYWPAVIISMMGHGLLVWFVVWGWSASADKVEVVPPTYIKATLVELEQKQKPKKISPPKKKNNTKKQQLEKKKQQQKKKQAEKKRLQQEQERKNQLAKKLAKAEAEKKKKTLEAQRKQELIKELEAERQQELQQAIAEEKLRLEAEQQAAENATLAQSYNHIINQRVSDNWSRPPSARNDMRVLLRIQLVPTGDVIGVEIIESSGDNAFDRSAVRAVKKAESFPELRKIPNRVFEQYFRVFNLLFEPKDLRQ